MPDVQRFHEKYQSRDDFKFITVSTDKPETMPQLRKLLKQEAITFPVLHYSVDGERGKFDWNVPGAPWGYLIDPQGNIVGNFTPWEKFEPVLDYFLAMDEPYQPYGIETRLTENEDGSYQLAVHVTSPAHETLPVWIFAKRGFGIYGERVEGEWQWFDQVPEGKEPNGTDYLPFEGFEDLVVDFEFGEFGESTQVFDFTRQAGEELRRLLYGAVCELPGIDVLFNGNPVHIVDQENRRMDLE